MKIKITFKDPDALLDCIDDAIEDLEIKGLDEDELAAVKEEKKDKAMELCGKWFEYGEYLTVEVDTEKETCKVLEVDQ